jgi:flagellar secretion chaperone FliS
MSVVTRKGLASYSRVAVESGIGGATPHRLVQMLFQGALDKIATAKGHVARKEFAAKSENISWAVSIISGLRSSLDLESGGEIAANLESLYEYMTRRLLEANRLNDAGILNEISSLLAEIKSAWETIPEPYRNAYQLQQTPGLKASSM